MFTQLVLSCLLLSTTLAEPCTTDEDCSLNGLCKQQTCHCDPGWIGEDCGILDLAPARRGTGYNHTTYTSPSHYNTRGNSSWGGQIIQDPSNPQLFHLFVDQFAHGCGLPAWRPSSFVVRAESHNGPQGPYHWAQNITTSFRHNTYIHYSPADSKYLLWTIGATTPSALTNCKSIPKSSWPNNISVAAASHLHGPWTPFHLTINGTNPAPYPLWTATNPTREIALVSEDMHLHTAPSWDSDTYTFTADLASWNTSDYAPTWTEDPFVWRDGRGNWHALAHWMVDIAESNGTRKGPRVGAHMFSKSLHGGWKFKADKPCFEARVEWEDGTEIVFLRRERPKLWFGDGGGGMVPMYLVTGVQEVGKGGESWTLVQPVGRAWREFEEGLGFGGGEEM